jgi:hypothetical protein
MKRISHFITEQQDEALKRLAATTGLGVAELLRRAIDLLLKEPQHPIIRAEPRRQP